MKDKTQESLALRLVVLECACPYNDSEMTANRLPWSHDIFVRTLDALDLPRGFPDIFLSSSGFHSRLIRYGSEEDQGITCSTPESTRQS